MPESTTPTQASSTGNGSVAIKPWLRPLVLFTGAVCSLAWFAAVMPFSWMNWWHELLGLGEMPQGALVEYLTRATGGLCGVYGLVLMALSRDMARYLDILRLVTYSVSGLAVICCTLMWNSGLPTWWLLGDLFANLFVSVSVFLGTRKM
jgi:hypothetical protein